MFVCVFAKKFPALASQSCCEVSRPRAVGKYEYRQLEKRTWKKRQKRTIKGVVRCLEIVRNDIFLRKIKKAFVCIRILPICIYFFPSLRAGGILQILQFDWFRERVVFYDLAR